MLPATPGRDLICPLMSVPVSGKQGFQHRLGCFLVEAMLGRGCRGTEGFFEEGHSDSLSAAHLLERGRGPGLPLDHLGEQSQPHGDDLSVLGKSEID